MKASIWEKEKKWNIEPAFLKLETVWKELIVENIFKQAGIPSGQAIKIKVEVNRQLPMGFGQKKTKALPFLCKVLYILQHFCRQDACATFPKIAKQGKRHGIA